MAQNNFDIAKLIQSGKTFSKTTLLYYVWKLSIPSMLAQISSTVMQYIDTAMIGHISSNAAASIGLVSPTMWLGWSVTYAFGIGFSVQLAQAIGANDIQKAKHLLCQSILVCSLIATFVAIISCAISGSLPIWLGGEKSIQKDASEYFFIFQIASPVFNIVFLLSMMLQSTGDTKTPAILNASMCALDVLFNFIFIMILNLGVKGAALGSVSATLVIALVILYVTFVKSPYLKLIDFSKKSDSCKLPEENSLSQQEENLHIQQNEKKINFFKIKKNDLHRAFKIAFPLAGEKIATNGAMIASTRLIAPLGAMSLAASTFAVTAESICYMLGFGIEDAATTLVGQSIGAKRLDLAKQFSWLTILLGVIIMTGVATILFASCPLIFAFLTSDVEVQKIATKVLRIGLFSEPFFACALVAQGALRGANDTLVPAVMNFSSIWIVRIGLTILLIPKFGLIGAWCAMAIELFFRGTIFLIRLATKNWEKN